MCTNMEEEGNAYKREVTVRALIRYSTTWVTFGIVLGF